MAARRPLRLVSCVLAALTACLPKDKDEPFTTEATSDSSSTDTAPGDVCGDAQAVTNVYCYEFHTVDSVAAPKGVVAGHFADGTPWLAVFAYGSVTPQSALLRLENGSVQVSTDLPIIAPSLYEQFVPVDLAGSSEPDILYTGIYGAARSVSDQGVFSPFEPLGLPEEAHALAGHTIPFDLGQDGSVEFIKGSQSNANIWHKVDDLWVEQKMDFPVPGCGILIDFAFGDFNGDALADLAYLGNWDVDTNGATCDSPEALGIVVLLQTESGQLVASPMVSTGQHAYVQVEAGDLDADGADDLVTLARDGDILAFRSSGDGAFTASVAASGVIAFQTGNVDGDPEDEIVLFDEDSVTVIVDSVFNASSSTALPDVSGVPVGTGDLNQDGVLDLVLLDADTVDGLLVLALSNP